MSIMDERFMDKMREDDSLARNHEDFETSFEALRQQKHQLDVLDFMEQSIKTSDYINFKKWSEK